jgi:hypothetical protein
MSDWFAHNSYLAWREDEIPQWCRASVFKSHSATLEQNRGGRKLIAVRYGRADFIHGADAAIEEFRQPERTVSLSI